VGVNNVATNTPNNSRGDKGANHLCEQKVSQQQMKMADRECTQPSIQGLLAGLTPSEVTSM
jgi:hypothetical protein